MTIKCLNTAKGCLQAMGLFIVRFVQMLCTHLEHNVLEVGCLLKLTLHERYYYHMCSLPHFRTPVFQECEKEHKRVEELLLRKSEDACCAKGISVSCSMVNKNTMTGMWLQRSIGQVNLSVSTTLELNRELSQGKVSYHDAICGSQRTVTFVVSNNISETNN